MIITTDAYDAYFKEASQKYNVDFNLLKAVGMTESSLNPSAESKSGAKGIMQIMPSTFKSLSDGDIWDAKTNIDAGAKYLSQMLQQNGGDVNAALASYNAGYNNVKKYGKEKYSSYYQTVNKYIDELGGMSASSSGEKDVVYPDLKLPWNVKLYRAVFMFVILICGIVLLGLAIGIDGNLNIKKG